jgi:hypothetical protein
MIYEIELEEEIEIEDVVEDVVVMNGYVVDRKTGKIVGRVYAY